VPGQCCEQGCAGPGSRNLLCRIGALVVLEHSPGKPGHQTLQHMGTFASQLDLLGIESSNGLRNMEDWIGIGAELKELADLLGLGLSCSHGPSALVQKRCAHLFGSSK
jgi:hypothetical protein